MSKYFSFGMYDFISSINSGMVFPFLIIFLREIAGGRLFDAAIFLALYTALSSLFSPLFGWVSDRTGRRGWVILASLGSMATFYWVSSVTHLSQLYPLIALFSLISGMSSVQSSMSQDLTEGKMQGSKLNALSIVLSIGTIIGTYLGGNIIEMYGFPVVFLMASFLCLVEVVPLVFAWGDK